MLNFVPAVCILQPRQMFSIQFFSESLIHVFWKMGTDLIESMKKSLPLVYL